MTKKPTPTTKPKPPTIGSAPKKKRRDPMIPVKPPKAKLKVTPGMLKRRTRIDAIRERTRIAQREIDEIASEADVSDLAGLPVIREIGPRRSAKVSWRNPSEAEDDSPLAEAAPIATTRIPRKERDIYLIESDRDCGSCGLQDHPGTSCKELAAWLEYSGKVLSGEVTEVDPEIRRKADERARAPKKRGRRRKPSGQELFDAMTNEEQLAYLIARDERIKALKTGTAASPSPAPNPSS